jgi:ATP-binding cassette subfamily B protein
MKYNSVFAFFWHHIKPYKWLYAVMMLAPVISSFYYVVYNYAVKLFLDAMTEDRVLTYQSIMGPILLYLSAQITLAIIWRVSNVAKWKSEPYVRRSIVLKSYDYVQHHSYTFFQDNFTGATSSKIKGLLDGYDKFWEEMHHGLAIKILDSVVGISSLFFINMNLGLFFLGWTCIYGPVMYWLSLTLNKFSFIDTENKHAMIGQVSDRIMNMISLFSFASRKRELKTLNSQISDTCIPSQIRVYKYDFKIQIIADILYIIMLAFVLFYMLYLRMQGKISVGDFAFVFGMVLSVARSIWESTISMQDFSRAMGDCKSSLSILNVPQENLDIPDAKPLKIKTPKIEFKNFSFTYKGGEEVFKNLNLTIKPGENVGLVGESGAGKSSLINLLLRYFESQKGEILIDGQNINTVTQDSLRENIAVIPQDTMLFHRTLMENIRYGNPNATEAQVIAACRRAHIHEFIMGLPEKYNAYVGERGIKLSGGQRQRIAIARAILKHAPILILDEATSALDSQTEKYIQEGLSFFLKDKKNTVIAIAHRLSTLKHMDRIIVLDKGKVVEEGTHDQLIRNKKSLYSKLWKLQEI